MAGRIEQVEWQGRTIHTEVVGSGPPLVLVHGTPWSSWVWRPLLPHLRERWTVHLWDLPGYGRSSKNPEHGVDLPTQSRALADLLETWGLSTVRPHVVAHDIGGAVALGAALDHGARLRSLALLNAVVRRPWGSPFYRLMQANEHVFSALPAALHAALVREYVAGTGGRSRTADEIAHLAAPWLDREGQEAFYRQVAQVRPDDTDPVEARLAGLDPRTASTGPVIVIWGVEDTWLPLQHGRDLAAAIPSARFVAVPDAGHLVQLDRPAELVAVLDDWLKAIEDPREVRPRPSIAGGG